jgi:hypothetical protein
VGSCRVFSPQQGETPTVLLILTKDEHDRRLKMLFLVACRESTFKLVFARKVVLRRFLVPGGAVILFKFIFFFFAGFWCLVQALNVCESIRQSVKEATKRKYPWFMLVDKRCFVLLFLLSAMCFVCLLASLDAAIILSRTEEN